MFRRPLFCTSGSLFSTLPPSIERWAPAHPQCKVLLSEVTQRLLDRRLKHLLAEGRLDDYRRMVALRASLLAGDGPTPPTDEDDGGLLERLCFRSPLEEQHGTTPLLLATRAGDVRAMRSFLAAGASLACAEQLTVPSFCIGKGQTPIHVAAWCGHLAAVSFLLRCRCDPNAVNVHSGSTALHSASSTGRPLVLLELVEHRVELDARSRWGLTAMETCIAYRRSDGAEALIGAGLGGSAATNFSHVF